MASLNYGTKMFLMCGSVIGIGTTISLYILKTYFPSTACSGPISKMKKLDFDRIMKEAEAEAAAKRMETTE